MAAARAEGANLLRRRRGAKWRRRGRAALVLSAVAGLALQCVAFATIGSSIATTKGAALAVSVTLDGAATRYLGLRSFVEVDESDGHVTYAQAWESCSAVEAAKALALAGASASVSDGLGDEADECARCSANVDDCVSLALAAFPAGALAFYCAHARFAAPRESAMLRYSNFVASLAAAAFLAASIVIYHWNCDASVFVRLDPFPRAEAAATSWGPGLRCLFAAVILRVLDLLVFALFPVRRAAGRPRERPAPMAAADLTEDMFDVPLLASTYESLAGT